MRVKGEIILRKGINKILIIVEVSNIWMNMGSKEMIIMFRWTVVMKMNISRMGSFLYG